ncbi:MAG: class I SAM-dependent methyltransferase [Gammaproteobacteria bacterium]|nr:class I SAM-dependent methyltransferase [Gammaproteobacteria bacterium]
MRVIKDIVIGIKCRFQRIVLKKYPIRPLMKQREIRLFEDVIDKLNPMTVLEWGCGFSTLYFPQFINSCAKWYSVEHNLKWYEVMSSQAADNTDIHFVDPIDNYNQYINFPDTFNTKFDLIIIDGRERKRCLEKAKSLLSDQGVIMVHDANRKSYWEEFDTNDRMLFLDNSQTHNGGVFIHGAKYLRLDIKKHRKVWNTFDKLSKVPMIGQLILKIS